MDKEIIVALIGAVATIATAIFSNLSSLRERKNRLSAGQTLPIFSREIIIMGSAFIVGCLIVIGAWIFTGNRPINHMVLQGGYIDRAPNGEPYFAKDKLIFDVYNNHVVKGIATSEVKMQDGTIKDKKFHVQGYLTSNHLFLSYLTDEIEPRGVGSYILERSSDNFIGRLTIKDSTGVYTTPYLAIPQSDTLLDETQCKKICPKLMHTAIIDLDLNPDLH